ncbi:hypothetical protein TWF225_002027 [Orbilia oligospora]|uniref:Uncharacterized protein n=1 Tax=Orbilia oligospora TaxID=2813651 RepID=A0A7C8PW30_ORBOL|nr:hypothetical protein TWF225_002027 [Orbilia oligospora]KAF3163645.1 hypothetical protein TWF225_002027 [Orbilia oligospora]KAF3181694.1 hypothetical protein TWF751_008268 [Orbilia oligospora]KAF3242672.1 hypothetical protein TWF128_010417 [Orbilia oligospora]KAF3242673.1 hypothetical protein TWF128_010417 [Orbilia oligospora]
MASASALAPKKTYDIVQQGIKELHNPANADIDIVAVPGLGAPPLESWKSADPKLEFNWLTDRDGLAKEFPRARILLYMYQSAWTGPLKVRQFMSNLAMTLLYGLKEKRKDAPRRPIVFIGHSMGGIVIAKAISIAESRRDLFGKMFEAVTGCIFFGTPFQGASVAAAASMFAQVSEFLNLDQATASKLLDLMKPDDESLRDIRNEFVRLSTKMSPKIELWCFYEERPTDWSKQIGLPFRVPIPKKFEDFVTRESATLTGVDSMGLARIHRELVKFDSFKDTVYQLVRGPLKTIINSAPLIAKNRFNSTRGIDREVVKNVLNALEGVQVEKKRKRSIQGVISSSWILHEQEYKQWLQKDEQRSIDCLWVLGPEGKGKLGASLAALDHIEDTLRKEEAQNSGQAANLLAYFLCDQTSDGSSPEELLKSFLRQLVNQQEVLAAYAKQFVNTQKDTGVRGKTQAGLTVENLWQSLQDMLTDELLGTVYFVVNNLHLMDEQADSVKKLMTLIGSEWQDSGRPRARVRWLFTSQTRHSIKQALDSQFTRVIDLDDEKYGGQVQQELRMHAQKKIAALGMEKGYNKALTYFAGSLIGKRAQNTQWIDITIIQLAELPTDAKDLKVRSLLERIPQDLRSLLDRAWISVLDPKDDKLEEIKEMLRTLIITYEEPTEDDLAILTGLSHDAESRAHLCSLVEKCRPLLTFRKSSNRIGFMNSVVKMHLLENAEKLLGLSKEEIRWQHGIIALRSFSHITQYYAEPEPEDTGDNDDSEAEGEHALDLSPAANPDTVGAEEVPENTLSSTEQPATEPQENGEPTQLTEVAEVEYNYYDDEISDSEEEIDHMEDHGEDTGELTVSNYAVKHWLHHASKATTDIAENLSQEEDFWKEESSVRKKWLVEYNILTNAFDGVTLEGLTGLHVAASIGFSQLVSALIKNGHKEEIGVRDKFFNTPLHLAAFLGRPNICEVLLNSDAKIDDGQDAGDQTPLAMAAYKGHCRVMIKLLDRGANPNALAEGRPVINEAIVSGNLEAVQLLVEHGAILAQDDNDDDNPAPLALSALLSDLTMFAYLLDACADKIPHKEYNKALISSASAGRLEVTKRLLQFNHDIVTFQAALEAAADEENWEIVLLILESSRGLDCDDVFSQIATSSEQQDRLLTAIWKHTNGVISQETIDESLYEAVDIEKESTVKLLLEEFGANANATGVEYGNALTAAAFDGTIDIVRMLLDHNADVNSPNGWALQTAAEQGHLDVVELLVERGANVNACLDEGKFGLGTALQGACEAGQDDVVAFLLKHGADPNVGAGPETCPIIAACRRGEAEILKLLIDAGATIDRFGGPDMSSPLINAAGSLYKDSVERLLNAGADINLADQDGDTALIVAANVGDAELVAFLLEKGADITHVSKRNVNALQTAMNAGATECVDVLIEAVTRVLTALNTAIENQDYEAKRILGSVDFKDLIHEVEEEDQEEEKAPNETSESNEEEEQNIAATNNNIHPETKTSEDIKDIEAGIAHIDITEPEATATPAVANGGSAQPFSNGSVQGVPDPNFHTQASQTQYSWQSSVPQPQFPSQQVASTEERFEASNVGDSLDVVPSPLRQNPAFPGYQDYNNFRKSQDLEPNPQRHNFASTTTETLGVAPQYTAATGPQSVAGENTTNIVTYTETMTTQPIAQSQTDSPADEFKQPGLQVTIADQLQAYQPIQETNNPSYQTYQNYQSYQSYQRPSRKPLGSSPVSSGSPKQEVPPGGAVYPTYSSHQGYQSQQSYQTPPPSQGFQSPSPVQGYQNSGESQGYQTPAANQQGYHHDLLPQGYQNQTPSGGYNSPTTSQDYQNHRLPSQHYQNYQSTQPGLNYGPPDSAPAPTQQPQSSKPSFGHRLSSYFQSSSSDQSNQSSRYKYNDSWS